MYSNSLGSSNHSFETPTSNTYRARYEHHQKTQVQTETKTSTSDVNEASSVTDTSRADSFDVDALVNTIWSLTSSRIEDAKASGASESELDSMWQSAQSGVEQGFGEAKDILDSLGVLDDELKLKIDSAFGQILDKIDSRSLDETSLDSAISTSILNTVESDTAQTKDVGKSYGTQMSSVNRQINLYQYQRQTFSLDIMTAQGDKISIRSVAQQESNLEDMQYGSYSSTQWQTNQSDGYSLFIKGDLNDQERADLDALLEQVNALANEFYEGDLSTAFDLASELGIDGTSLQKMNLSMKEVETTGAAVYAANGNQTFKLPQGLEPLKEYAQNLVEAQQQWLEKFESPSDLLNTLNYHPNNNGKLSYIAEQLLA